MIMNYITVFIIGISFAFLVYYIYKMFFEKQPVKQVDINWRPIKEFDKNKEEGKRYLFLKNGLIRDTFYFENRFKQKTLQEFRFTHFCECNDPDDYCKHDDFCEITYPK